MSRASYTPMTCKSAMNRVQGMTFKWSLNPYRGCAHACQYCYARETHRYLGLNAGSDFETTIFYKANIAEVLDRELHAPGWAHESVAIGTATDAYQPAEGRLRVTRACLEVLTAARNPLSIVTKSTLVLRDQDCLAELSEHARVRVYFTITTLDKHLWKELEPGTPPPARRLYVLSKLAAAGIETGVLMAPVMPDLTDSPTSIESVAHAAAAHGASTFTALPLRLAPLVKDHFMSYLSRDHPDMLGSYSRIYRSQHAPADFQDRVSELGREMAARYGLDVRASKEHDRPQSSRFHPSQQASQLSLF